MRDLTTVTSKSGFRRGGNLIISHSYHGWKRKGNCKRWTNKKCMWIHATGENFKLSMFIQVLNDQTLSLEIPDLHVPDLT